MTSCFLFVIGAFLRKKREKMKYFVIYALQICVFQKKNSTFVAN